MTRCDGSRARRLGAHARLGAGLAVAAMGLGGRLGAPSPSAHTLILSKFTYNREIRPVIASRCGTCHRPGGVGPMSLLTYQDAFPWAQAIKEEVLALRMPPALDVRPTTAVRAAHGLSARELDVLVDWTNGATPEGEPSDARADGLPASPGRGRPDLALVLPEVTLGNGEMSKIQEFSIPTGLEVARFVRALDVVPEAAAMVRAVDVWIEPSRQPLGVWVPGQGDATLEGAGFELPPGSSLGGRVVYKKTWSYESATLTDRTRIALYFEPGPRPKRVETIPLASSAGQEPGTMLLSSPPFPHDVSLLAVTPRLEDEASVDGMALRVEGREGESTIFEARNLQPAWLSRIWLAQPVRVPGGSRVVLRLDGRAGPAPQAWVDVLPSVSGRE